MISNPEQKLTNSLDFWPVFRRFSDFQFKATWDSKQVAALQKSNVQMLLNHLGCYDFQSKARIAESVVFQQAFTGFCDFQSKTKNTDSLDF